MKITVITSDHPRHLYLIKSLQKISKNLLAVIEPKPYIRNSILNNNTTAKNYFKKVKQSELKIFKKSYLIENKRTLIKVVRKNEINFTNLIKINLFLNSDYYIVFGSSIIKDQMLKYLIKKKALNIHMGFSPYYRGTDCNFWAMYDGHPGYVGGTVMKLSKKIDAGNILLKSKAGNCKNKFDYMMSSCKNVVDDLTKFLSNKPKLSFKKNNLDKCIRFTKRNDFKVNHIKKFMKTLNKI